MVYGVVVKSICSFDLKMKTIDTLRTFAIDSNFWAGFYCTFDRYNGIFYLGKRVSNNKSKLTLFDVDSKEMNEFDSYIGDFEYDLYRYRLLI